MAVQALTWSKSASNCTSRRLLDAELKEGKVLLWLDLSIWKNWPSPEQTLGSFCGLFFKPLRHFFNWYLTASAEPVGLIMPPMSSLTWMNVGSKNVAELEYHRPTSVQLESQVASTAEARTAWDGLGTHDPASSSKLQQTSLFNPPTTSGILQSPPNSISTLFKLGTLNTALQPEQSPDPSPYPRAHTASAPTPASQNGASFQFPRQDPPKGLAGMAVTMQGEPSTFKLDTHNFPTTKWDVMSSWRLQNPCRRSIEWAYLSYPKESRDLLLIQQYKSRQKDQLLSLSRQVCSAETFLNECEKEEIAFLLALEENHHDWHDLSSDFALGAARAARKTVGAIKHLADAKAAHARALAQQLSDEADEALSLTKEADHQLLPIINAFTHCGWSLQDVAAYSSTSLPHHLNASESTHLTFEQLKDAIARFYPAPPPWSDHSPMLEASAMTESAPEMD